MLKKKVISFLIMFAMLLPIFAVNTFAASSSPIIRNDEQPGSYYRNGSYSYSKYTLPRNSSTGGATVYYPTGSKATPPFSGIVYCPPYTGTQRMLAAWGPFFASHGIVLVTFDTRSTSDSVDSRAKQQRIIIDALKSENTRSGSLLNGKLDTDRIGAMGWSMGGGATWINSAEYQGLATAMSLAGHNQTAMNRNSKGGNTKCPTLIMNGAQDRSMLGGMGQSTGVYNSIPSGVPKVIYEVSNAGHMSWNSPTSAGNDVAAIALAFQKTFLDGDTRWAKYITEPSRNVATWKTANIPTSYTVPTPITTPVVTPQPTDDSGSIPIPTSIYDPQTDFSQKGPFGTTTMRMSNHTVYYPQSLGKNGLKHPIILWGNGTGARPSSYTGILNHLASYGFVVIAANTTMAGSGQEMIQGLDIMIAENAKAGSVFYDKLDTEKVGATGHSQGGIGTVAAALKDSRIDAAVPLMGTKTGAGSLKSPVLAIAGSADTIVSPTLVKRIYTGATGTAIYAELQGASHMAPSGRSPSKEILYYTTAWFSLYLMGDNSLQSIFFDSGNGINVDREWKVTSKNLPDSPIGGTPTPSDPTTPSDPSDDGSSWLDRWRDRDDSSDDGSSWLDRWRDRDDSYDDGSPWRDSWRNRDDSSDDGSSWWSGFSETQD